MPEKTKLEDYANMNNTGFAFIDLNEDLKEVLKNTNGFIQAETVTNEFPTISSPYELNGFDYFEKIKQICESNKPLLIKLKIDVVDNFTTRNHLFYDEILWRNARIWMEDDVINLIVQHGLNFNYNNEQFIDGKCGYINISIYKNDNLNKTVIEIY